ncbi:MAG: response regulator [Burkholderiaceae bacterium]
MPSTLYVPDLSDPVPPPADDLSALAWVQDELKRSLDAAHKALRRFLRDAQAFDGSDVDAVDPAVLRAARVQLHQGAGALELVGLPTQALVLRASEAAVQRCIAKPPLLTVALVGHVERASFALLDYLGRLLAGKPVSALQLFPPYRALQEAAGAERVHPADLWPHDWKWRELPADADVAPRRIDAATRLELEGQLLEVMRGAQPQRSAGRMSEICAGLGAGASSTENATLWKLAAAVFQAQDKGLLGFDVFSKRVASRLLAQFRALERGDSAISPRLAQDLLFFCAQSASPGDGRGAPRLWGVRQAYGLAHDAPVDYSSNVLGRHDPAWIAQARKRVGAAKESWSALAGGEPNRLPGLVEQVALVSDSLKRLFPHGEAFGTELQRTVATLAQAGIAPSAELAMEVATCLLYVEAALEDADFDAPEQAPRVLRLIERLHAARHGRPAEPLEAWAEELYRRVSDRQTMGSVVQELRASLAEAERLIDQFFRSPTDHDLLVPVPVQMATMRGVLSVLGMDHAAAALAHMRDEIERVVAGADEPQASGLFDRLASNLGALGFLIDMLSVQPQMAKSLFAFDPARGSFGPVMGRDPAAPGIAAPDAAHAIEPRLIEQVQLLAFAAVREDVSLHEVEADLAHLVREAKAAEQPGLAATVQHAQEAIGQAGDAQALRDARSTLSEALVDFVHTASSPVPFDGFAPSAAIPLAQPAPTSDSAAAPDHDAEMREVFLEEAREVLHEARSSLAGLSHDPTEVTLLTGLRRAFHTLKGSSRMVGLDEFGAAAWVCEQFLNTQLAEQRGLDPAGLGFTGWALDYLAPWVDSIAQGTDPQRHAGAVEAALQRLHAAPVTAPAAPPVAPLAEPAEPSASIRLAGPASEHGAEFELDLSGLDALAAAQPTFDAEKTQVLERLPEPERSAESAPVSGMIELDFEPAHLLAAPAPAAPAVEPAFIPEPAPVEEEHVKRVGALRIGIALFNIFLNEADELSRKLGIETAEWALELHRPVSENAIALAHSLAGSSATVGFSDLSHLARTLEHALTRSRAIGQGTASEAELFVDVAEEVRRLLHQFAAGFLKSTPPSLLQRLAEHEVECASRLSASASAAERPAPAEDFSEALAMVDGSGDIGAAFDVDAPVADTGRDALAAMRSAVPPALVDSEFGAFDDLRPLPAPSTQPRHEITEASFDDELDAIDAVDAELFPIFEEEALELVPRLAADLRAWAREPAQTTHADACMRTLHTLKGGARLAGAMRMGELAHRLETGIEDVLAHAPVAPASIEWLQTRCDALEHNFDHLRAGASADAEPVAAPVDVPAEPEFDDARDTLAPAAASVESAAEMPAVDEVASEKPELVDAEPPVRVGRPVEAAAFDAAAVKGDAPISATPVSAIDWSRFLTAAAAAPRTDAGPRAPLAQQASVRVRAPLLDRLVNQAGEVSITRSRIEAGVDQIKGSLVDLTENLERLRGQLRDIELQAETQMSSRLEAAKAAAQEFDPLESDRFTRFQELTRMMAESVNDVATVQRTLQRALETTEDELVAQARMTRELQDDLLRTRMVEFEGLSDRLYRVVRQAAKETGKQVRLDIVGGAVEVDRGVLDRMTGAFEHLLRNCVTHGIESPDVRSAIGKPQVGVITVTLSHAGNEVEVEVRDDGAGLDLQRIRAKAVAMGLVEAQADPGAAELAALIFTPGFTTATQITELAGRGVGMDVVRSEVDAIGGRVETASEWGQGTAFKIVLPLTTAVTQVVRVRCGATDIAIPSTLVETVRRVGVDEIELAYESGMLAHGDRLLPFFWLGALLQGSAQAEPDAAKMRSVVIIRSAQQRVALHVDEVIGNQEVVVKHLGPQLSRVPGLVGMSLLTTGAVALIYNPVALATLYGEAARNATRYARSHADQPVAAQVAVQASPLVLVVDDSLTVRRITQRMLVREGYRVALAKDGLDALERLAEERPMLVLSDIEMPRMDGFDLLRNIRAEARWRDLPVIMITSRIAQKHRDHAFELGVDHYLGKPYSEDDLLALVGRYATVAPA